MQLSHTAASRILGSSLGAEGCERDLSNGTVHLVYARSDGCSRSRFAMSLGLVCIDGILHRTLSHGLDCQRSRGRASTGYGIEQSLRPIPNLQRGSVGVEVIRTACMSARLKSGSTGAGKSRPRGLLLRRIIQSFVHWFMVNES